MWEGEKSFEQGSGAVAVISLLTLGALDKDHPHVWESRCLPKKIQLWAWLMLLRCRKPQRDCMHTGVHTCVCVCMCSCVYVCANVNVCTREYVCVHVCIHVYAFVFVWKIPVWSHSHYSLHPMLLRHLMDGWMGGLVNERMIRRWKLVVNEWMEGEWM